MFLFLPLFSLGGVTICRKGSIDVISNGRVALICAASGCPRRVGGQGDVLAGACGTFIAWTNAAIDVDQNHRADGEAESAAVRLPASLTPNVIAAYAACIFCRRLQQTAFAQHGRSMLPTHLLQALPEVLEQCFPIQPTHNKL